MTHRPRRVAVTGAVTLAGLLACAVPALAAGSAAGPVITVAGQALSGATVPLTFTAAAADPAAGSVKFLLDGVYLGVDEAAPFTWDVTTTAGGHTLKARSVDAAGKTLANTEAAFTAAGTTPAPTTPAPTPTPTSPAPTTPAPGAAVVTVDGAALAGATLATGNVTVSVNDPTAVSAKFTLDGVYLGEDNTVPLSWDLAATAGAHSLRVRAADAAGVETRYDNDFTVTTGASTPPATPTPEPTVPSTRPADGRWSVGTLDEIRAALAGALPGDVITVADGEYQFKPRLIASASGTAAAPITLRGSRAAMLRTKNASGDYGLSITGSYWRVEGITVAHATKGIVLDGSVGTVLDGVEVYDIGDEAVHFRKCSTDGVLRNSSVHDTGQNSPQYGEGVYVGSANSNWALYECTDPVSGQSLGDNSERVLIEDNTFENITAEGADLKEGTDSGILRNNRFIAAGISGQNSADSAVDVKGNNWLIQGNTVSGTDRTWSKDGVTYPSEFLDGFQVHNVYAGYGQGSTFTGNVVEDAIAGSGFGIYQGVGNVVKCDNSAPLAALGLITVNTHPAICTP